MEITITLGISSFIILIVQDLMNKTNIAERSAGQALGLQSIVSKVLTTLDNVDSCTNTLINSNPVGATGSTVNFRDSSAAPGNIVFSNGQIVGSGQSRVQISQASISHFEDNSAPYFNGANQATVTVVLRRGSAIGVDLTTITAAQREKLIRREGTSRLEEIHRFPVRVELSSGQVTNCLFGLDTFRTNLEKSCEMLGGVMGTSTCRKLSIEAENGAVRKGSPKVVGYTKTNDPELGAGVAASPGLYLDGDMLASGIGHRFYSYEFRLLDHLSAAPVAGPDPYAIGLTLGVIDMTSNRAAHGGASIPGSSGMLNSDGTILVGGTAQSEPPATFGITTEGGLTMGASQTITLTDPIPSTPDDDMVPSAEWFASAIADTMSDGTTVSVNSLRDTILSGGTETAKEAILSYMCKNMVISNYNSSATTQASSFNGVNGVWVGGRCRFTTNVKSNCSVNGSCNEVNPDTMCIDGVCMTRWPYLIKGTGTCTWRSSCSPTTERSFGTRTSSDPAFGGFSLCCPMRVSDVNPT